MVRLSDAAVTLRSLRRLLLLILLAGMSGTAVELLLLAHDEDWTQLIPLVLLAMGLAAVLWTASRHTRLSIMTVQLVMLLFIAGGLLGVYYHYAANVEFQREVEPELAGSNLLWKVLQAKTPPALSPGVMIQLGLIGLAYVYRHPAVARGADRVEENWDDV